MLNADRRAFLCFLVVLTALLCLLPLPAAAQGVELKRDGQAVVITVDGKPFTTFFFGPDSPKPYFHPLRTASGRVVTRGFPMIKDDPEEIRAKYQDHPHHRGLWYAHGYVNGVDFWSEGQGRGHIVFQSLDQMESGKEGRLTATFQWVTPDGRKLLTETKKVVVSGRTDARILDIEEALHAGSEAVKMGDTKEGTFALRVAVPLAPQHGGTMVNSEGASSESPIWGKRANWVDYWGQVGGATVGVAIFDNPGNPKYPTYWHSRAYGLHSANPYGEHDYYNDKTRDGSITIPPDGVLTFRYRVYIHDGDTTAAKLADEYRAYSAAAPRAAK
jgi:hypothetical protein